MSGRNGSGRSGGGPVTGPPPILPIRKSDDLRMSKSLLDGHSLSVGQSAQVAYLSSVSGLDQIRDHFGVWAFSQRVCGRSAITNPELYRTRDSLAILSKQGNLSKPADL
jgi:hypothetical protein